MSQEGAFGHASTGRTEAGVPAARIAYGLAGGGGLLTPFADARPADGKLENRRLGATSTIPTNLTTTLSLESRRTGSSPSDHRIHLGVRLRF